jgi:phytoene desaturase
MKIVVIGSGFGGLSCAIRLQGQGHEVTIVEKRDKLGGRAYVYEQDGFKFDGGPTIITAPWLIDEIFEAAGKKTADYVKLVKLDPFYNIRWEDGMVFHYNDDRERLLDEIRKIDPEGVEGYKKLSKDLGEIYRVGFELIDQPFTRVWDMVKVVPEMIKLRSDKSVYQFASKYFKNEKLREAFSFHPLLIGGNPFTSTSIYSMIHELEQKFGVWFAMGGTGALVKGFGECFMDIGGEVFLEAEVSEILIDENTGKAKGVKVASGEIIEADAVVANSDVARTYLDLIPSKYRKKYSDAKVKKMTYSMSLFVIYFGTDKKYENMAHHEIILGNRYKGLLDEIFVDKTLADDFSLYLHRPTATDPSLAPEGCDCWYVLSPVPNLEGKTDWKTAAEPYKQRIYEYLEKHYMPDLRKHIISETHIDPIHFQDTLNSYLGNAFGVEPTLFQSAWLRPHNISEDIPNLYLVGAGTHPGA